jgi:hypothetical protein
MTLPAADSSGLCAGGSGSSNRNPRKRTAHDIWPAGADCGPPGRRLHLAAAAAGRAAPALAAPFSWPAGSTASSAPQLAAVLGSQHTRGPATGPAPPPAAPQHAGSPTAKPKRGPRQARGRITIIYKLMLECFRDCRSWQPWHHLTQASPRVPMQMLTANTGGCSPQWITTCSRQRSGRSRRLWSRESSRLWRPWNRCSSRWDAWSGASGTAAGCRWARPSAGCARCTLHSLWCQVRNDEPQAAGVLQPYDGRCGKIQLIKGAATPVPELTKLTEHLVTAVTEADLWHHRPLSWWFGSYSGSACCSRRVRRSE